MGDGLRSRRVTGHRAINEKYAFDPDIRSLTRAYGTPAKHPTPPLPPYRAQSPTPEPCEHALPCHAEPCSWSMPLTKYRLPTKEPKDYETYPQAVVALSRRLRNRSQAPLPNYHQLEVASRPSSWRRAAFDPSREGCSLRGWDS